MEQPAYRFIEYVANLAGLGWLLREKESALLLSIAAVALACCLFGFYLYRGMVSAGAFFCVVLIGNLWARPAWGGQAAVTFCAVVGVVVAFLAFRWYRLGAVLLAVSMVGSLVWMGLDRTGLSPIWSVILSLLCGILVGVFTFFFPLWGTCGVTALWGGLTFAMEGWRLVPPMPTEAGPIFIALFGGLLAVVGSALQLLLFRRQKLFKRIMPERLAYRLEKRKQNRRGAAA